MGNSNHISRRINTKSIKRIYEYCDPETVTEELSPLCTSTTSPDMESISSTQ
jgi:hypothetical protein